MKRFIELAEEYVNTNASDFIALRFNHPLAPKKVCIGICNLNVDTLVNTQTYETYRDTLVYKHSKARDSWIAKNCIEWYNLNITDNELTALCEKWRKTYEYKKQFEKARKVNRGWFIEKLFYNKVMGIKWHKSFDIDAFFEKPDVTYKGMKIQIKGYDGTINQKITTSKRKAFEKR